MQLKIIIPALYPTIRAVPNIRFVFASVPNSLFVFGQIVINARPNTNSLVICEPQSTWHIRLKMLYRLDFSVLFTWITLTYLNQPIINDMHIKNSQFRDKYNIKSFEHTTVLTSALHTVNWSKQNCVFLFVELFVFVFGRIAGTTIRIWPNTLNPYSVQP